MLNPLTLQVLREPVILIGIRKQAALANYIKRKMGLNDTLTPSNVTLFQMGIGIPMEKASPYVEKFNKLYLKVCEHGLTTREWDKENNMLKSFLELVEAKSLNISMNYVMICFLVGNILALMTFGLECFFGELKRRGSVGSGKMIKMKRKRIVYDCVRA